MPTFRVTFKDGSTLRIFAKDADEAKWRAEQEIRTSPNDRRRREKGLSASDAKSVRKE